MKNNKTIKNTLIKKKNLLEFLRSRGIKRISPNALEKINFLIKKEIKEMSIALKEMITIKGKKTLHEGDINEFISRKNNKEYPEI